MTKSGIEVNLPASPYVYSILYKNGNTIHYHFSSLSAFSKFDEMLKENRTQIRESLSNRFRISFYISDDMCDVVLYRKLERRGFYIRINGGEVKWPGMLTYGGTKVSLTT